MMDVTTAGRFHRKRSTRAVRVRSLTRLLQSGSGQFTGLLAMLKGEQSCSDIGSGLSEESLTRARWLGEHWPIRRTRGAGGLRPHMQADRPLNPGLQHAFAPPSWERLSWHRRDGDGDGAWHMGILACCLARAKVLLGSVAVGRRSGNTADNQATTSDCAGWRMIPMMDKLHHHSTSDTVLSLTSGSGLYARRETRWVSES